MCHWIVDVFIPIGYSGGLDVCWDVLVSQKTVKVPVFRAVEIFSMAMVKILSARRVINAITLGVMAETLVLRVLLQRIVEDAVAGVMDDLVLGG